MEQVVEKKYSNVLIRKYEFHKCFYFWQIVLFLFYTKHATCIPTIKMVLILNCTSETHLLFDVSKTILFSGHVPDLHIANCLDAFHDRGVNVL